MEDLEKAGRQILEAYLSASLNDLDEEPDAEVYIKDAEAEEYTPGFNLAQGIDKRPLAELLRDSYGVNVAILGCDSDATPGGYDMGSHYGVSSSVELKNSLLRLLSGETIEVEGKIVGGKRGFIQASLVCDKLDYLDITASTHNVMIPVGSGGRNNTICFSDPVNGVTQLKENKLLDALGKSFIVVWNSDS